MTDFKMVLAIDSALQGCGVGLYDGMRGRVFSDYDAMARGQAERLIPMVQDVLAQAGKRFEDLDTLVVTAGPGTFTGLRIGLSAAKSLSLALEIPLFGITSLQAMALHYVRSDEGMRGSAPILVVLETKRQDFYVQAFDAEGQVLGAAQALGAEQALAQFSGSRFCVIGDAARRFCAAIEGGDFVVSSYAEHLDCGFLAQVFVNDLVLRDVFLCAPEPVYLRGADVSLPKTEPRKLQPSQP